MRLKDSGFQEIINDSVPMQALSDDEFDRYLREGWRLLGSTIVRHSISWSNDTICDTIPLRVRLPDLRFSKSQRQLLRRNAALQVEYGPIRTNRAQAAMFCKHAQRFAQNVPPRLEAFIGPNAAEWPVRGIRCRVRTPEGTNLAYSFFHMAGESVSGTYCFFDTDYPKLSLGSYTMLLEMQKVQELGYLYYYPGYCYNVPSEFDYKLNFNALEAFDWDTRTWNSRPRLPLRPWRALLAAD